MTKFIKCIKYMSNTQSQFDGIKFETSLVDKTKNGNTDYLK